MNGARAALHTAVITHSYWPLAFMNSVFKHKLMEHTTTGEIPFLQWTDHTENLPHLHDFGQKGRIPNLLLTAKLQARVILARYAVNNSTRYTRVYLEDVRFTKVKDIYFHLAYNHTDPTKIHNYAFASFKERLNIILFYIRPIIRPSVQLHQAL